MRILMVTIQLFAARFNELQCVLTLCYKGAR